MRLLNKIMDKLHIANRLLDKYHLTSPSMEPIYRDLFLREIHRAGIEDIFYPVGAAANHSLLYLIARMLREPGVKTILELGAGQSTLLIDRMRKSSRNDISVTTLEHDPFWASQIQAAVDHDVHLAPLSPHSINGQTIEYYHHPIISAGAPINLLIVDGPPAFEQRISLARLGALDLIPSRLAPDFAIIIDDSHRSGESKLAEQARQKLRSQAIKFRSGFVRAASSQTVIAAGNLLPTAYF